MVKFVFVFTNEIDLGALESERTLQNWKTADLVLRYILVLGNSTKHEFSNAHQN